MGCDIHAHVEYQRPDRPGEWWYFAGVNGVRSYRVFGALTAGAVRGDSVEGAVEPRGFPSDADDNTREDYYEDEHREVEPATADAELEAWRARLPSTAVVSKSVANSFTSGMGFPHDGRTLHVSLYAHYPCPDWHNPSWLTAEEVARVIGGVDGEVCPEWWTVVDLLRSLDARGLRSRLVFWFDN